MAWQRRRVASRSRRAGPEGESIPWLRRRVVRQPGRRSRTDGGLHPLGGEVPPGHGQPRGDRGKAFGSRGGHVQLAGDDDRAVGDRVAPGRHHLSPAAHPYAPAARRLPPAAQPSAPARHDILTAARRSALRKTASRRRRYAPCRGRPHPDGGETLRAEERPTPGGGETLRSAGLRHPDGGETLSVSFGPLRHSGATPLVGGETLRVCRGPLGRSGATLPVGGRALPPAGRVTRGAGGPSRRTEPRRRHSRPTGIVGLRASASGHRLPPMPQGPVSSARQPRPRSRRWDLPGASAG